MDQNEMDQRINGSTDQQISGSTDQRINGRTDQRINDRTFFLTSFTFFCEEISKTGSIAKAINQKLTKKRVSTVVNSYVSIFLSFASICVPLH